MNYAWRKMTEQERIDTLERRKADNHPWHRIPCIDSGDQFYLITSTCFNHEAHIGYSASRMSEFSAKLLEIDSLENLVTWAVLPNHYHLLCRSDDIKNCKLQLGHLHGSTSFDWNNDENKRGRKVWFGVVETVIKSDRHYWATINYIHNNPVKHRCVKKQGLWPWSGFQGWEEGVGRDGLVELWKEYSIEKYGTNWDLDDLSDYTGLVDEWRKMNNTLD